MNTNFLARSFCVLFVIGLCLLERSVRAQEHTQPRGDYKKTVRREQWFRRGRVGAGKQFAAELRYRAYLQKLRKRAIQQGLSPTGTTTNRFTEASNGLTVNPWVSAGPAPIVSNATGSLDNYDYGPVVGRVTAIAVDQTDPTGNTVYVGGATGGLWKSTNAADPNSANVAWTPLLDHQPSLSVGAIALQPGNGKVILGACRQ
jgi:hypothetical protein